MAKIIPRGKRSCWDNRLRETCKEIFSLDEVRRNFFLTGGAALAVFWLGHRRVDNIDLFTTEESLDFNQLAFYLNQAFRNKIITANEYYIDMRLPDRVRLAKDHLSLKTIRPIAELDGIAVPVDTLSNLLRNKMSAFVSRFSENDAFDLLYAAKRAKDKQKFAVSLLVEAQKMEVLAEDTLYVTSLFDSIREIYPAIAKSFPMEIRAFKGALKQLDNEIDSLYR